MAQFVTYLTIYLVMSLITTSFSNAQTVTGPEQNCPDALPVCTPYIFNQPNSYSGWGTLREIPSGGNSCPPPAGTCTYENNTVWYKVRIIGSGELGFQITPNNPSNDYDWVVYNITNTNCATLATSARTAFRVSCNFSGQSGNTGATGVTAPTCQGAGNGRFNPRIPVVAGETYVIVIDNFSASQNGYTLDFANWTLPSAAAVIGSADTVAPSFDSVTFTPPCGPVSQLNVVFSKNIACSSIQASDFLLTGPGGPFTITQVSSPRCTTAGNYTRSVTLTVSPPLTQFGTYSLQTVAGQPLSDLCANVLNDTITFSLSGPQLTLTASKTTVCQGQSVQLQASGTGGTPPYTYSWQPAGIFSNPSAPSQTVTVNQSTTYIVTLTDAANCSRTDSVRINLAPPIVVSAMPPRDTICGDTTQISTVIQNGTPPFTAVWSPAQGLSSATDLNPKAFPATTTQYIVNITDAAGCTGVDTVVIVVGSTLPVTASGDTAICKGDTVQLGVTAGSSYLWQPATKLSNPTIQNPRAFPDTTTTYIVRVSDAQGCLGYDTVVVTVNPSPNALAFNDTTICLGGKVRLRAQGGVTYQWIPSVGVECPTCEQTLATPDSTRTYRVIVTNAQGCKDTAAVNVTVLPAFVLQIQNPDTAICAQDTVQVRMNAQGALQYRWQPTSGISDPTIPNPKLAPLQTTRYTVAAINMNGCTAEDTITITVRPRPVLATMPPLLLCNGESRQIILAGTRLDSVQWFPSTGLSCSTCTNPVITASIPRTYTIVAKGEFGCNDTTTLNVVLASAVPASLPASVDFGNVSGCQSFVEKDVTISNPNSDTLLLREVFFSNTAFSVITPRNLSSLNPFVLPPASSTSIRIRFTPFALGLTDATATLQFGPCTIQQTIQLSGEKSDSYLSLSKSSLSFGTLPLCPDDSNKFVQTLTIKNISPDSITIQQPANVAPFVISSKSAFPKKLAPDEELQLEVTFAPSAEGSFTETASIPFRNAACAEDIQILLSGNVFQPALQFSGDTLSLPPLFGCELESSAVFTVKNTSLAELTVTQATLPTGFSLIATLPLTLASNEERSLEIRFNPPDNGTFGGVVQLDVEPCSLPFTFFVNGRKEGISLALPQRISFDTLYSCRDSLFTRSVTIENTSNSDTRLTIEEISLQQPFSTNLTAGLRLAPRSPFAFNIQFRPTNDGFFSEVLRIKLSPCDIERSIIVEGFRASVQLSGVQTEDFGILKPGLSQTKTLTWRNTGNTHTRIDSAFIDGNQRFSVVSTSRPLPATLLPNESIDVTVSFVADTVQQVFTGRVVLQSNNPCAYSVFCSVTAAISAQAKPELQASALDYEGVYLGFTKPLSLPITNIGDTTADIRSISVRGANAPVFRVTSQPTSIQAGRIGNTTVEFTPAVSGNVSAELYIQYADDSLVVPLSGFGARADADLPKKYLGSTDIGSQTTSLLPLSNTGEAHFRIVSLQTSGASTITVQRPASPAPLLQPREQENLEVTFTPSRLLTDTLNITAIIQHNQHFPTHFDTLQSNIYGIGAGFATVRLPDTSVNVGTTLTLPLLISVTGGTDVFSGTARFRATISFNKTILQTVGNTPRCSTNTDSCVVTVEGVWTPSSPVLYPLECISALGNSESTMLHIRSFEWLDSLPLSVQTQNGKLTLKDIYREGGNRLVDTKGRIFIGEPSPNPASGAVRLRYGVIETGITSLYLVDNLGKKVLTVFSAELNEGEYELTFSTGGIAAGAYHIVLQTPTIYLTKKMIITP